MQLARADFYVGRRKRRGVFVPAVLSAAALALGAYVFLLLQPSVEGAVLDAYTGQPLGGATVSLGAGQATTDASGRFTLPALKDAAMLRVDAPGGYAGVERELPAGRARAVRLQVRPTTLEGTITRKGAGTPLAGMQVQAVNAEGGSTAATTTDEDGRYRLTDVPEDARLIIAAPGFARREIPVERQTTIDLELRPDVLTGVVRTRDGKPLKGATVGAPGTWTTAGPDGAYTLGGIPEEGRVTAKASGYRPQAVPAGEALTQDFALEPLVVKSVYLTPDTIRDDQKFNALVALADRTEINAMVLDFKDESGWLHHDSRIPLAHEIGAVHPDYDLRPRLQTLKHHSVYTIARVVAMQDDTLASKRPDLAVRNSKTGGVWANNNGVAWANAMRPEVWNYNIAVALEAVELGFDEIQYDYVRFPSDGDMDAIDVGTANTTATRTEAIYQFLKRSQEALAPLGVPLSIDIFGIAMWDPGDTGIGQQLEKLAPAVDYVCPMIYPSHFFGGSLGFDIPNDHPYEVILYSLQAGAERMDNPKNKLRPWLQDFSYGRGIAYGPNEIRAQTKATYDFGATGWMLWNAKNTFTEAALLAER
jgi:hypothetical protein